MPERSDVPTDIAKLSFEDALKELEEIVRTLESGKGKLDEAIKSYERGVALKRHCERKLAEAQSRIEKITLAQDGGISTESASFG
ncbi:MAG TPA: exodeoxyribonuclease VII small subunit [Alphaproteobacteria bacterium]